MTLSEEDAKRLHELLQEEDRSLKYNQASLYDPYPWQQKFMAASADNRQKLACCANRVGKSYTGALEVSYHATGLYPEWWKGKRFHGPIKAWACGMTNNSTRDVVQSELIGEAGNPELKGTGAIPLHCLGESTRKPGVPHALDSILVKHHNDLGVFDGWSKVGFMSYEMGQEKYMGQKIDWVWLDEEPPSDIFTQCVTRTATTGGVVSMTFTPEKGLTEIVGQFMNDLRKGQYFCQATWEDVMEKRDEEGNVTRRGHLTEELVDQLLAVFSPHEREMRTKGIPMFGSGMVFPVHLEEELAIEAFELPSHWPRICGLDFGWDHPTAACWFAWDRDSDVVYLYDCYSQSKATAVIHSDAIRARGNIPVAWPKDGLQSDKGSGIGLAEQYREQGIDMLPEWFKNAPNSADQKGVANAIEPGIQELYQRMENGTFKVFKHLADWFDEFRVYHRDDGKIVAKKDDLMSATRYGACSLRFARLKEEDGYGSSGAIDYLPLGPGY